MPKAKHLIQFNFLLPFKYLLHHKVGCTNLQKHNSGVMTNNDRRKH